MKGSRKVVRGEDWEAFRGSVRRDWKDLRVVEGEDEGMSFEGFRIGSGRSVKVKYELFGWEVFMGVRVIWIMFQQVWVDAPQAVSQIF